MVLTLNGHPQPIQPMVQSAMFYPNTYINFTQAGEYTKHYYNGTERICSRLGEQQIPISVENNQELEAYKQDVKQIIYNAIGQHLYDEPTDMQEGDVIHLEYLQPCGNSNAVYYYHPNHLSSSMYVTDMQQSVVQSFLYAPYGEIISEYNTHAMGEAFPKYSFNAKELDEETGMYYYEARYYASPTFISRDPLMSEKPWLTPYHYCSNNPIGRVDPSGMFDKEKQAEKSREKAIKKYGSENVSDILKNEDGQYYYNIYGNKTVSFRNDGCKRRDNIWLNTTIVKLETRQVFKRIDYWKCIKQDRLGFFSRTNEISFGFALGTTGAVFCLDAYPDYIPLKEAKIAKGFYKAGKFASGVGVVAGIANIVNTSISAADDGRLSFGEGLRICIQLGATISSGFPGIGTAISLGISTIDLFWGDAIEKIGSK